MCQAAEVPQSDAPQHPLPHEANWIHEDQLLMEACLDDTTWNRRSPLQSNDLQSAMNSTYETPSCMSLLEHERAWYQDDELLMESCLENDKTGSFVNMYNEMKKSSLSKGLASAMIFAATMAKLQAVAMSRDT